MKNNKKTIIITSIILGVLILTISLTYAVFSMSKTGQNSNLVVGDVYMHYANGSKSINLANVMPSETYDATSFFEFTIDGKNTTTNKDIWYEIILKHGDEVSGKTRIKDNLLKFTLTETKNGTTTTVFDGRSYNDLTNKRIWVNTINKNTTSEVSITYRLYMWISNATNIGNTEDVDYTTEEWKNIFASIKVDVAGDFNEKTLVTDESCFSTLISNNEVTITGYDESCGTDVTIPSTINGLKVTTIGNGCSSVPSSFNDKSINKNNLNFYTKNNDNYNLKKISYFCSFSSKNLTSIQIPDTVTTIEEYAFAGNQLTNVTIPDSVITIGSHAFPNNRLIDAKISNNATLIGTQAFAFNKLTSIDIPDSVTEIGSGAFEGNQLTNVTIGSGITVIAIRTFENNQLKNVIIPNNVTTIEQSAFEGNQLTNIEIPDNVILIGNRAFNNNNLPDSQAYIYMRTDTNNDGIAEIDNTNIISYGGINKKIIVPNGVVKISDFAFSSNQLTSVEIPDSVTTIGQSAFAYNQLTAITVGNGIQHIDSGAFEKTSFSNPNLSKVTIYKSCADIKKIQGSEYTTIFYPWLYWNSPWTASGVTIYGSNNEVCDSY